MFVQLFTFSELYRNENWLTRSRDYFLTKFLAEPKIRETNLRIKKKSQNASRIFRELRELCSRIHSLLGLFLLSYFLNYESHKLRKWTEMVIKEFAHHYQRNCVRLCPFSFYDFLLIVEMPPTMNKNLHIGEQKSDLIYIEMKLRCADRNV